MRLGFEYVRKIFELIRISVVFKHCINTYWCKYYSFIAYKNFVVYVDLKKVRDLKQSTAEDKI